MSCLPAVIERIRHSGPITVADYMRLALYHPEAGYYATAERRSGRAGDFFTSVDVGPEFGALLGFQFAEMWRMLEPLPAAFDLVEAGAGNGRLARDILTWAEAEDREFYLAARLHLVEIGATAREAQRATLAHHGSKLVWSACELPERVVGVVYANELLDSMPVHVVEMTAGGLCEVFVDADGDRLVERRGPPSSPALAEYLADSGARLEPGWRAEVGLDAIAWVGAAARALDRGFVLLIDYGHLASELHSDLHAGGTLRAISRHVVVGGRGPSARPPWLEAPGERDLTVHVNLTSIRAGAERAGLATVGMMDQSYFLLGLGLAERLAAPTGRPDEDHRRRMALKSLVLPGGPGSAHKVLVFAKGVGRPALGALSRGGRVT